MPAALPRPLGRGLYWVGIPLAIFALARQAHFARDTGLAPLYTVIALGLGLALAMTGLAVVRSLPSVTPAEARVGDAPGAESMSPDQSANLITPGKHLSDALGR